MARNGSGVMSLLSPIAPAGQTSNSTNINATMNDVANEITGSLPVSGVKAMAAALPMGGFKVVNVGAGTSASDASRVDQVQAGTLNWVAAGGTADVITATYAPAIAALVDGLECNVRIGSTNTVTTPTFSPNGLTARTIVKLGGSALSVGELTANREVTLRYNLANTRWELATASVALASTTDVLTGTDAVKAVTADALAATYEMGSTLASAATLTIGEGGHFFVTGTTTITAFNMGTSREGRYFTLLHAGIHTITGGASIQIPTSSRTTAVGDVSHWKYELGGIIRCVGYHTISGQALTNPAALSTASGTAPSYSVRAWVNFNGIGTPAITASGNVTSITDNGTGDYTINFTTALPNANYAVFGSVASSQYSGPVVYSTTVGGSAVLKSTTQCRIRYTPTDTATDAAELYVAFLC
jgi:hypothetical protein